MPKNKNANAYKANNYRKPYKINDLSKVTTDGLDYDSIVHGIRCNRKIFGPVNLISIDRGGFEGRYRCIMRYDGITIGVYDNVLLDKPKDCFLLFSEKIAQKIIDILLQEKIKSDKFTD